MRQRVFGARVCIHELPFFKYDFYSIDLAPGLRYLQPNSKKLRGAEDIRVNAAGALVLHFKSLQPDFREFVKYRIKNNRDWNDAAEYRSYLSLMDGTDRLSQYDQEYTRRLSCIDDLDIFLRGSAT